MPWIVADVIGNFVDVIYVADGRPLRQCFSLCAELMADIIANMADGMTTLGQIYFNLSSEVLNRTSSHI